MSRRSLWPYLAALMVLWSPFSAAQTALTDRLYDALRTGDLPRLRALVRSAGDANATDGHGATPLMYAAAVGSIESMKLLIDKGADVNARSASGATALIWSATDLAKLRLLLDHGAQVNVATKSGRTTLLVAALSDHSAEIVRLLLAKGADGKTVDSAQITSLEAATLGNDTETIRMLIETGADVNAANVAGLTPLMIAAGFYGNVRATRLLLDKGANVNAVTGPSIDPPDVAKAGPVQLGSLTPLLTAASFGPPDVIKLLLDAGADVNAQDIRGMTPLMLAVATDRQNPAAIRMLLDRGARLDPKSKAGETAGDWARKIGLPAALDLLKVSPAPPRATPAAPQLRDARSAAEQSMALLEQSSARFYEGSGCVSCHHQAMTDMAAGEARSKGVRVDDRAAHERLRVVTAYYSPDLLYERLDPPGAPEQTTYSLAGLAAMKHAPDRTTDAMAVNVAAFQAADGSWHLNGVARPPGEEGDIFRTALAIRSLTIYGPPGLRQEMNARIQRARHWLIAAKPLTAEDRNMQLLGLFWAGTQPVQLRPLAAAIAAGQQPDGGWRQRDGLPTDAYATGQCLYALAKAGGVDARDASFQRGVKFLVNTQADSGAWRVVSRSPKFQVFFNSGFPYAGDQWISAWATGWATMAIVQSLPASRESAP